MAKILLPDNPRVAQLVIENETKKHELTLKSGILGRVFGVGTDAAIHIVGLIAFVLVFACVIYTFIPQNATSFAVADFWKTITPILTTLMGFLFGRSVGKEHQ
ncbi:MAG: hypothetical protein ACLPT4_05645 [Verrucomicrobiia bacterium]